MMPRTKEGKFKKGFRYNTSTEFRKGGHYSVSTEFKSGNIAWNKGKKWLEMSGENHPQFGKSKEKMEFARKMRANGYSLKQIAESFKICLTTASVWCRSVKCPVNHIIPTKDSLEKRRKALRESYFKKSGGVYLTDLKRLVMSLPEYDRWHLSVFKRDSYVCKEPTCDKSEHYLEVHHINTYSSIIKKNNIKSVEEALYCSDLWDINNGITLCKKCHRKTYKQEDKFAETYRNIINNLSILN